MNTMGHAVIGASEVRGERTPAAVAASPGPDRTECVLGV